MNEEEERRSAPGGGPSSRDGTVRGQAGDEPAAPKSAPPRLGIRGWVIAGVALLLAAGAANALWPRRPPQGSFRVTPVDPPAGGPTGTRELHEGDELVTEANRACGALENGWTLCLDARTTVRLVRLRGPGYRVALERGTLAVSALRGGASEAVTVTTPEAELRAEEAVCAVSVAGTTVQLTVLVGSVGVADERSVVEGERLRLPGWAVEPLSQADRREVVALLRDITPPVRQPAIPLGREAGALGPEPRPSAAASDATSALPTPTDTDRGRPEPSASAPSALARPE